MQTLIAPIYKKNPIVTTEKLALALGIDYAELCRVHDTSNEYYKVVVEKIKSNGSKRVIYDVDSSLKIVHARICDILLKEVEYPSYLNGSIKGRDYKKNAHIHRANKILIQEDITNFFPSISKSYIRDMWIKVFGFSPIVAEFLSEIVTYEGYLVQGIKPSSFIGNLIFFDLESSIFLELAGKGIKYSRYVDDMTISCNRPMSNHEKKEVITSIYSMLYKKGCKPNRRKQQLSRKGQSQRVHGLNVSSGKVSMPKEKRNRIRGIVFQCEKMYEVSSNTLEYKNFFNSVFGKVNEMISLHSKEGKQLKDRLQKIKPI